MVVIVMGVSGAGKSTIGMRLAASLGWRFIDADDHHPPGNIAKMARGTPLTDDDRWPWLDRLNALLREAEEAAGSAVLACSALRQAYRLRLGEGLRSVRFVYLHADQALIAGRLAIRQHRYMPASLLASQFAALEPPRDGIVIEVKGTPEETLAQVRSALFP